MPDLIHKNFRGQLDDEFVVCYFRRHFVTLIPTLLGILFALTLLGLAIFYLPFVDTKNTPVAVSILLGFILLHALIQRQFLKIFYFYLRTVIVTNYRIVEVDKSLFFKDSKTSIDLVNVQDIEKTQSGIVRTVLNYGSLIIYLSGSATPTKIDMVPRPEYQYKKINQVKAGLGK